MKFLIILAFTLTTGFCLPDEKFVSRNIVVPVGKGQGRITNGFDAHTGQFPYQAGLSLYRPGNKVFWCGGTLISNTEILTAAHCVDNGVFKVEVMLGAVGRNSAQIAYIVHKNDIIIHPSWNRRTLHNDIAIIRIPHTPYSNYIQAAKLPTASYSFAGNNVVASGWGDVSDRFKGVVPYLKYANMVVMANEDCAMYYNILPSNICIFTLGHVSTCQGDSGGPLVLQNSNILIGVTSYGSASGCEKNLPAVFTRVTSFLDWIKQNSNAAF